MLTSIQIIFDVFPGLYRLRFRGYRLYITFEALKILSAKGILYQFKKLEKKYQRITF